MNIFYTNPDPILAAREHCTTHAVKMITEHNQMLSTAWYCLSPDNIPAQAYKKTHVNHPSAVWVRASRCHYMWLVQCTEELCRLYTEATGKRHKGQDVLAALSTPPDAIRDFPWQDPPVAAPDRYKAMAVLSGTPLAYQAYIVEKFAEWAKRDSRPIIARWWQDAPKWSCKG